MKKESLAVKKVQDQLSDILSLIENYFDSTFTPINKLIVLSLVSAKCQALAEFMMREIDEKELARMKIVRGEEVESSLQQLAEAKEKLGAANE